MDHKLWFHNQVFFPRVIRSCLWMLLIQTVCNNIIILCFKVLSWNPVTGIQSWILNIFYWKSVFYHAVLSLITVTFATVHMQYYSVERHICSTRFERIYKTLNLCRLQHVLKLVALGGLFSYCWLELLRSSVSNEKTMLETCFLVENGLDISFVVMHGFYTGMIFSLKYFICDLYLVKFSLMQETKFESVNRHLITLIKENILGVLKVIHWHYIFFIVVYYIMRALFLKEVLHSTLSIDLNSNTNLFYNLVNIPLFFTSLTSGAVLCFSWNLYICIFNAFVIERHEFLIQAQFKDERNKILFKALKCEEIPLMKYLAVLDLRLLTQYDAKRRQHFFAISNPGGHPHYWNALSEIFMANLQDFHMKLNQFLSFSSVSSDKLTLSQQKGTTNLVLQKNNIEAVENNLLSPLDKVQIYLRERPFVSYFLDEIPNAKIMKLFASSQHIVWIIEALGYFIAASYTEDKYGVVQRHMSEIICLLLDLKMAEEKLPMGIVGMQRYVTDSQGRYDHLHQRFSIKCAVNFSLKKISTTFKEDISGIYLPKQYQRSFQRYVNLKDT